jgi:hypothetical protein
MKQLSYARDDKGEWKETVQEVPDDDTPQKRRVKAMAEAEPGRIVVGWAFRKPGQEVEDEKYLDELGPDSNAEGGDQNDRSCEM